MVSIHYVQNNDLIYFENIQQLLVVEFKALKGVHFYFNMKPQHLAMK